MSIIPSKQKQKPVEYIVTLPDSAALVETSSKQRFQQQQSSLDKILSAVGKSVTDAIIQYGEAKVKEAISYATRTKTPILIEEPARPAPRVPRPRPKPIQVIKPSESVRPAVSLPSNGSPFIMNRAGKIGMRKVSQPAAKSLVVSRSNKPKMSVRRGNIVVSHSEMIGPVVSSSSTLTYSASGYVVNPGNVSSFPWLSTFASNFDKYRILKLSYVFVSNQPTTIAGRVGLGFDYDSTDVLPGDRPEFYTLTHHVETPPWQSVRFDVPVESTVKFVNSHTVTDSKLIDAGQLIVMSDQIVGAVSNLGDVIVEYSVELLEPQQAVLQTQIFAGNNVTPFNLVASGPVLAKNVSSTAATTILSLDLPIGYYLINVVVQDTGLGTPSITGNGSSSGAGAINGRFTTSGGTAWQIYDLIANATINGARLTFTCALSWSALETAVVTVSRVSAPVYSGILSRYQNVLP